MTAAFGIAAASAEASELNCTAGGAVAGGCTGGTAVTDGVTGQTYSLFAGALWQVTLPAGAGTAVVDTFVQIDSSNPTVQGMNTSYRPVGAQEDTNAALTGDLKRISTPVLNINGTEYFEFMLDINQKTSDPLISLDQLKFCSSTSGGAYGNVATQTCVDDPASGPSIPTTLRWDLDSGGNNRVALNHLLNAANTAGDLLVYIPVSTLNLSTDSYFYLWSQFGATTAGLPTYDNDNGPENWNVRINPPGNQVPEPASLLLLASGLLVIGRVAYRRRSNQN